LTTGCDAEDVEGWVVPRGEDTWSLQKVKCIADVGEIVMYAIENKKKKKKKQPSLLLL
jgi:hypothetical protein